MASAFLSVVRDVSMDLAQRQTHASVTKDTQHLQQTGNSNNVIL